MSKMVCFEGNCNAFNVNEMRSGFEPVCKKGTQAKKFWEPVGVRRASFEVALFERLHAAQQVEVTRLCLMHQSKGADAKRPPITTRGVSEG